MIKDLYEGTRLLPSLPYLLPLAAVTVILWVLGLCLYRLRFHPLSKYPGPWTYKLSDWPLISQCMGNNRHLQLLKDHQEYGPVVRLAPNYLSFTSDTALKDIYGSNSINVCKSEWYITADSATGALSTFSEVDKHMHGIKRRFVGSAFTETALRSLEQGLLDNINIFCRLMSPKDDAEWSEKKEMNIISTWLGLDIMGELAYSKRFDCLEGRNSDENRKLAQSVSPAVKFIYWVAYLPFASTIVRPLMRTRFVELLGGQAARDNIQMVNCAIEQFEIRVKDGEKAQAEGREMKDFVHYLLKAGDAKSDGKEPKWRPSREDLYAESLTLINAGAEPFAVALSASLFYLLHNPRVLKKATAEVRSTFSSPTEIHSGPTLNSLTYLQAVMEETLRRAPPVLGTLPRTVLPGGAVIDGALIPAGTIVSVPPYAIHHHPAYFPEPWAFRPERWIVGEGVSRESVEAAKRAFCPFSRGVRGCIGKNVAYLELKLTLAHLLYRFEMRLAPGYEAVGEGGEHLKGWGRQRRDEYQLEDWLGAARKGPWVQFKVADGVAIQQGM